MLKLVVLAVMALSSGAAVAPASGLNYVSIGSSFAAGPGVPSSQPGDVAKACARSNNNYPSLVARAAGANLTDVSCSGATTANVLTTSQGGQAAQVTAVKSTTQVVTVTIGGNDVDYLGSLDAYTCQNDGNSGCATVDRTAIDKTFGDLPARLTNIANAIHSAAPQAKVYFVNYFTILPDSGTCADVPLTADQLTYERSIATRLKNATATAASATGSAVVDLAAASHGHDACSASPWVEDGHPAAGRSQYHPNEAGMKGAADAVQSALATAGQTRVSVFHSGIAGKCIDVANSGTADGTVVQLYGCDNTDAQRWTWVPGSGGTLRSLGKCLDVSAGGTADRTKVQLWTCNGSAQRWIAGADSSLINPQSGRCLDDPGSSTADRTPLQIYTCNTSAAQKWQAA